MKSNSRTKILFRRNLFIITSLVSKDFKLKYRRSALGVLWSVLNPLLMMCVLTAVFSNILKFGGSIENFPLYLILGNILFALMADSTGGAMSSILESAPLIKKIRVSKMVFPIEKVLFQLVNFAISLIAVAIVMIFFQITPTINLLALPLLLLFMMLFCAGLGMLLSALAVFFRDVCHLWGVIITAWTYATPLFYPIDILPDWMKAAEVFNPMYHYVTYFRDIAMNNVMPGLKEQLICFFMALITFIIGFAVFKATEKKFILYV
ncbi:MAG: ABC transporter permease [Gordonibacter sp.]|nr:ABC transporter permease [Gordonibacter sp.]